MTNQYKLYGVACSLYVAKARSYMRKQAIDFVELSPRDPHYASHIMPQIRRLILPVIETPDGELIQDGADIIDHFEAARLGRHAAYPQDSLQRAIAFLFELFGGEGLLRPAMHYRWDYDDEHLHFLTSEFSAFVPRGSSDEVAQQVFAGASGRMRKAKRFFGVTDESTDLVKTSYAEFLALFDAHLRHTPYLLGNTPTIGDYGLMAPLYGHLYRDPVPAAIMRKSAPRVARWVERMNAAQEQWWDHDPSENQPDPDATADSLKELLRYVAEEYLPEISAHVAYANEWLELRPEIVAGTNGLEKPTERTIGMCEFEWRGIRLSTSVMPYRFYLLQRLQDCYDEAGEAAQAAIRKLMAETGLQSLLELRTIRRVERENHLEVWGPLRQ